MNNLIKFVISIAFLIAAVSSQDTEIEEASTGLYQIEGKIFPPEIDNNLQWTRDTEVKILIKN